MNGKIFRHVRLSMVAPTILSVSLSFLGCVQPHAPTGVEEDEEVELDELASVMRWPSNAFFCAFPSLSYSTLTLGDVITVVCAGG